MKVNKIICAAIAAGLMAVASTSVFAAEDGFKLGTPVDLKTGKAVTELAAGQHIAIPVDITSTTNGLSSFTVTANFDSAVVEGGVNPDSLGEDELANIAVLGDNDEEFSRIVSDTLNGRLGGIGLTKVKKALGSGTTYSGSFAVNTAASDTTVKFSGTAAKEIILTDGAPELYLIFTVKAAPTSTALNASYVSVDTENSMLADNYQDKGITSNVPTETEAKTNACAGAFKVVVDAESLPKFLHALYVSFDDGATKQDITEYVTDDDKVFEFPVRVSSTQGGSVTATIYADLGTTDATVTDAGIEIGSVTVDLSGTATDYTAATTSIK